MLGSGMDRQALARYIDHTLLHPTAGPEDITRICAEARTHHFYSVCVHPVFVRHAKEELTGSDVRVGTVIGFPLGANTESAKAAEARFAIEDGADELDMVMALGLFKAGSFHLVQRDIERVVEAAPETCIKVILETGWLKEQEIEHACQICIEAGAHFVKTSTGFGPGGAEPWDIERMRRCVGDRLGVKASGKIRSAAQALALIHAGASRLGTSASVEILDEIERV